MNKTRTFACQGTLAALDFTVEVPADWAPIDLPREDVDFDDISKFAPLAMLMAPYAAILFTVAARPAYASGTLAQWLHYAAGAHGVAIDGFEAQRLGTLDGVGTWGTQTDGNATMRSRIVFVEDGERLLHVVCMAPASLWDAVAPAFAQALATFTLREPRGRTIELAPPDLPLLPCTMLATGATATASTGAAVDAVAAEAEAAPASAAATTATTDDDVEPPCLAQRCALATSMATFEPAHEVNTRLCNMGAGTVPDVQHYHEQELWAAFTPPAIGGTLRVPFGWHVIDDEKRTTVFDGAGDASVQLERVWREGATDDELFTARIAALRERQPSLQPERLTIAEVPCLVVRGVQNGSKTVTKAFLLRDIGQGRVLQLAVTAAPERFAVVRDLVEVLLTDLQPADANG
jgi:hypothetical protein